MVDAWVLNAQNWVNSTYGNVPGFVLSPLDGKPSWPTMWALTRALQWELGITSMSTNFGPTTLATLTAAFPTISATTANANIKAIVQCALWCKGYAGNAFDTGFGTWDATTQSSIAVVRTNMGLSSQVTVFPKLLKSLLTMDAYTVIAPGNSFVRSIQKSFNGRYFNRADYFLIPCDGLFSRDVQIGLMYAIQYELDMADGVATGEFGPLTRSGLATAVANVSQGSTDSAKYFVHLFQAAMAFNGYAPAAYDGIFSAAMVTKLKAFQSFSMLPTSGRADFKTWASLLVSTGDPERTAADGAKAVDCITTITDARAVTLKANGYTTVGRYLSNTYDDPDDGLSPIDKNIKPGELATIFANGLRVFPIFQEGEQLVDKFTWAWGRAAAYRAHSFATGHGFKTGTVIYFAVDFDALEEEVYSNVIPFFQGVNEGIAGMGNKYVIGIYGARNTCSIVSAENLAKFSFVSGMSTAYSGNLGYPLPSNWAFDQIKEYTIGSGDGEIGIDKDIMSNRELGQSSVTIPPLNGAAFTYVDQLQAAAVAFLASSYRPASVPPNFSPSVLVLQYLRFPDYNDANLLWAPAAGKIVVEFIVYVDSVAQIPRLSVFTDPQDMRGLGFAHLAAAANGVTFSGIPSIAGREVNAGDGAGWAGDLVQTMCNWDKWGRYIDSPNVPGAKLSATEFTLKYLGLFDEEESRNEFPWMDLVQDIDGMNLGYKLNANASTTFAAAFRSYYGTSSTAGWRKRYSTFKTVRLGSATNGPRDITRAVLTQAVVVNPVYGTMRSAILVKEATDDTGISTADKNAIAGAFLDILNAKAVGH